MIDISHVDELEITISSDGKKLWINTIDGCKFRAYNIQRLIIKDETGRISWPFTNAELYEVGQLKPPPPSKS